MSPMTYFSYFSYLLILTCARVIFSYLTCARVIFSYSHAQEMREALGGMKDHLWLQTEAWKCSREFFESWEPIYYFCTHHWNESWEPIYYFCILTEMKVGNQFITFVHFTSDGNRSANYNRLSMGVQWTIIDYNQFDTLYVICILNLS